VHTFAVGCVWFPQKHKWKENTRYEKLYTIMWGLM